MNRKNLIFFIFAMLPWAMPMTVQAQSDVVEKLYGQGVHAYHSGMFEESLSAFDKAIELGTRDPRVYYYRGVTQSAVGNLEAAATDFSNAAQFEFASIGRFYSVGRALERVQGDVRMQIEEARQNARQAARHNSNRSIMEGPVVGSMARPVIADPHAKTGTNRALNFPDITGRQYPNVPFANTGAAPVPATNAETPATDPAPVDPAPPTEDPAPADTSDGSGDDASADDSPFGDEPADDAPADDDPFGDGSAGETPSGDEPAADDDPFGDGR